MALMMSASSMWASQSIRVHRHSSLIRVSGNINTSGITGTTRLQRGTLRDTTPTAAALQLSIHRGLTGADRLGLALEMSLTAREFSLTRLRREHPHWSDAELTRELLRYAFLTAPTPTPTPLPSPLR